MGIKSPDSGSPVIKYIVLIWWKGIVAHILIVMGECSPVLKKYCF